MQYNMKYNVVYKCQHYSTDVDAKMSGSAVTIHFLLTVIYVQPCLAVNDSLSFSFTFFDFFFVIFFSINSAGNSHFLPIHTTGE